MTSQAECKSDRYKVRYRLFPCYKSQNLTFSKMAAKLFTLEFKMIRTLSEGLTLSYKTSQVKCKSGRYKVRYRLFPCYKRSNLIFSKMAAKLFTLELKIIRTLSEGFTLSYKTSQAKCKSDRYKVRYRLFPCYKSRNLTFSKMAAKLFTLQLKTIRTVL